LIANTNDEMRLERSEQAKQLHMTDKNNKYQHMKYP